MAQARRHEVQARLGPALHPGALSALLRRGAVHWAGSSERIRAANKGVSELPLERFYEKHKPSFIQAYVGYIGA
jgi:hypothetical protein